MSRFRQVRALQLKRQASEAFLTPASSLTSLPDSAAAAAAQGVSGAALQVCVRLRVLSGSGSGRWPALWSGVRFGADTK